MAKEDKVLIIRRLQNRMELLRMIDPSLVSSGPISYLYDKLRRENEEDLLALMEESRKETMEGMLLRVFASLERINEQELAKKEEEILSLNLKLEDAQSEIERAKEEIACKNAQIALARHNIAPIIKEFESLIKDPDKLLSALKIVCDILDNGIGKVSKPSKYHYNIEVIKIAILTVVHARCSFRSAVAVLGIFQMYLPHIFEDGIPAYTTIRYWVIKSGLALIPLLKKRISGKYMLIVDESIVLNKQKMLVVLAAPIGRKRGKALSFKDVSIAHMEVRDSWKSEEIADRLKKVAGEIGRPPSYVLSDEGTNIVPAVKSLGRRRHRDIGHSIATMLKDTYEEEEGFVKFKKTLGSLKNLTLSEAAPFAPPKERSWARWLNIAPSIHWAMWILDVHGYMDEKVAMKFEELCKEHPGIVHELELVIDCVNDIMKLMKTQGLSKATIKEAKARLELLPCHFRGTLIMRDKINAYLDEEEALLEDENDWHIISSDIIESYFSVTKRIMPNAKFYGFTEYSLGMYTRVFINSVDDLDKVDILGMKGATSMRDIETWCEENLVDSAYDRKIAFKEKVKEARKTKKVKKTKKTKKAA